MVDEVLDELGTRESDAHSHQTTAQLFASEERGDDRSPRDPEIFWQIEEALEEIRAVRNRVSYSGATPGPEHSILLAGQLASTEARLARLARRLAR